MEQGNTPIYKHIKLLSLYSDISNNEFDIPSIIFERFAYLKGTPKAFIYSRGDIICQQCGDTLVVNNFRHLYSEHHDSC